VAEAITITDGIRVPARAIRVRTSRSSGPGGQNVNKVASRVDVRVDLEAIEGLPDAARERLRARAANRLDADGRLVVTSRATRDQARNLADARRKIVALVSAALVEPSARRAAGPTAASREQRLAEKKRRGMIKRWRAAAPDE
jgi:ribosome-associated protein